MSSRQVAIADDKITNGQIIRDLQAQLRVTEDELRAERRRYRDLQEQTGSALVRAHVARGDQELRAARAEETILTHDQREILLRHLDWFLDPDQVWGERLDKETAILAGIAEDLRRRQTSEGTEQTPVRRGSS